MKRGTLPIIRQVIIGTSDALLFIYRLYVGGLGAVYLAGVVCVRDLARGIGPSAVSQAVDRLA
jgi:hypothetical protein